MNNEQKQRPAAAPSERHGRAGAQGEPVPMTQEEVEAMARGSAEAESVAARLTIRSEKAMPQSVSAKEMEAIQESKEVPETVGTRITQAQRRQRPQEQQTGKQAPTQSPPET